MNPQVNSITDKIQSISKKFELAESLVSNEVQETIDTVVTEVVLQKTEYDPLDIMSVEQMADDFRFSRETLQDVIRNGREVLDRATQDLLLAENDAKAGSTMAFAELSTALLNGIKIHSQMYKDFSIVLLNLKKVQTGEAPTTVNNTIVTDNVSTVEIIERLRKLK